MPINRHAYKKTLTSQCSSEGLAYQSTPSNYGNATTKVINVSNNNWLSDSVVFTVDSAWRYVVHVRNTNNGASSIHINDVRVYGKNTATYLLCESDTVGYRFGWQNQERVDDISGVGNHYTAEYWEVDTRIGRRWNIDPVVKPHESPYAILANNPIWFIDPNGADTVEVFKGSDGFHSHTKAKGDDVFFIVEKDKEGNINRLNQISFNEGTLKGVNRPSVKVKQKDGSVENRKLTLFDIKGDENAAKLFEFFADPENTGVEWTHAKTGTTKDGNNIVGSSHDKSSSHVGHFLRITGYTLREVTHNHPSGIARPSGGDKSAAKFYHEKNTKTILKIYTHPNNYVRYNQDGLICLVLK